MPELLDDELELLEVEELLDEFEELELLEVEELLDELDELLVLPGPPQAASIIAALLNITPDIALWADFLKDARSIGHSLEVLSMHRFMLQMDEACPIIAFLKTSFDCQSRQYKLFYLLAAR